MERVLFCSVSIGAGHDLAARAVMQEIERRYPTCQTKLIDTFRYINPVLNKVIVGSYMESLKFNPKIWGYLYSQAEEEDKFVDLGHILSKLLSVKMDKLISEFDPQAIICTHAFPAGIMSILKSQRKIRVPLIAVMTDFTVHPFWIHEHVDKYVIPSDLLKYDVLEYGVDAEKLMFTGIPIRGQFRYKRDKGEIRRKLGLEDKTTVLVMGGGLGLGEMETVIRNLGNADIDLQIIAITGKNDKLSIKLQTVYTVNKVKVFGFIEDVAEIMSACDCIVTKPGGLTTAELLSQGLPIIIVNPLPGQEYRNTDFLLNAGVAIKVSKPNYLVPQLKLLLSNDTRVNHMREMASILGKPNAANDLVDYIESVC